MYKFKLGDKVRIKNTKNTRSWYDGRAIGEIVTLTNTPQRGNGNHPDNNRFATNFRLTDFEPYKEPKLPKTLIINGITYKRV